MPLNRSFLAESQIQLPIGADVPTRFQLVDVDEMHVRLRLKNTLFTESLLEPSARPWSVNLGSEPPFEATTRDSWISHLTPSSVTDWGPAAGS